MKYAIFLNGEYPKFNEKHKEYLKDRYLICADGGANKAYELGIIPNLIVGDLDSITNEVKNYFKNKNVPIYSYPCEKDYTDFQIALIHICNLKVDMNNRFKKDEIDFYQNKEIIVFGATGNRIDMSMSNIKMLEHNKNMKYITETNDMMYSINEKHILYNLENKKISIIPNSNIKNLLLDGFEYNLERRDIHKSQALVSNIIREKKAIIDFEKGDIIVVVEI